MLIDIYLYIILNYEKLKFMRKRSERDKIKL